MKITNYFLISLLTIFFAFISCDNNMETVTLSSISTPVYLNHHDSVKYIGMDKCKMCHSENHKTFIHTGMGSSFDLATPKKSSAKFNSHSILYDSVLNIYYQPFWKDSLMVLHEFRLDKSEGDTIFSRLQPINYIVGSGQHTNSHMVNSQGYITQAPFTYYTQDGHLDFPPGFDEGKNSRFSRKIGLECMSCHNGLPEFILGSENKYSKIPNGIDCERCHGPGELHLQQFENGNRVDTSKYIDYTIVNPAKLSSELQFDLCSRCHLQGNMVLKKGKNFYDFKPGMKLTEVLDVFLPKYSDSDDKFIMASHVDRLKMSNCFKQSDDLTCITCHNPHISVKNTKTSTFDSACKSCHNQKNEKLCTSPEKTRLNKSCVSCHMPKTGSSDIPHVRITDHKIGIVNNELIKEDKGHDFIELYCVNNPAPDTITLIKAYIQQYERFTYLDILLKKAEELIKTQPFSLELFKQKVHLNFLNNQGGKSLVWINKLNANWQNNLKQTFDNDDAWLMYRLAKAYVDKGDFDNAFKMYDICIKLAPYSLDFHTSYGKDLLSANKINKAQSIFLYILSQNVNHEAAYTPLAYSFVLQKNLEKASYYYKRAISINPNDYHARCNLAGIYVMNGKKDKAKSMLNMVLDQNPNFGMAIKMLKALNE